MGTTCVILIIRPNTAYFGHVGDSRIYLARGNKLYLMTRDHSYVQNLVDQGLISWDEAENHPRKNEITQALGLFEKVDPEVNENPLGLYKGDKFVLCTDGLSGLVHENTISEIISKYQPVEACERLVALANENGGIDNVTVQLVEVSEGQVLPDDHKDVPPEGSITRNSNNKPSSQNRDRDLRKTREIKQFGGENKGFGKKRSLKLIYFGILVLASIIAFVIWNPFSGEKKPVIISHTGDTNKTKIQDSAISKATLYDQSYDSVKVFLGNVYKGNDPENNYKLPANIKFDIMYFKDNQKRHHFNFDDFERNIKTNNLRINNVKGYSRLQDSNEYSVLYDINFNNSLIENKLHYKLSDNTIHIDRIDFVSETSNKEDKVRENNTARTNKTNEEPNKKVETKSDGHQNEDNNEKKKDDQNLKEPPKNIPSENENK